MCACGHLKDNHAEPHGGCPDCGCERMFRGLRTVW
jgi:hypothetical protein